MVRDLESTNGTMLDDVRIAPGKLYSLKHDIVIGLGISGQNEVRAHPFSAEAPDQ